MTKRSPKAPDTTSPAARVRDRIAHWLEVTGQGQREFAEGHLKKSQVWLQKILTRENDVRLCHLDEIARVMRTTAAELVRGEEERYQLELSPTEVRIIERLRHRPDLFDAISALLDIRPGVTTIQAGKKRA